MTQTAVPDEIGSVLAALRDGAAQRDVTGDGLGGALTLLESAGALAANAVHGEVRGPAAQELALVRAVARADASLGRVFDGHLNGVERLAVQAPAELAERELALVREGLLRVGVWGGDPRPAEGEPARVEQDPRGGGEVLTGVKTFCSGAGCLDRALVLARDGIATPTPAAQRAGTSTNDAPGSVAPSLPVLVWIDLRDPDHVEVDEAWYRTAGLRASASHRVVFRAAPVLARFGAPGAISAQPWFGRDALRTAASWAGMADTAVGAALEELARRPHRGELEALAAGRLLAAQRSIDAWLTYAAAAMDAAVPDLWDVALHGRVAIADAARTILDEAARACGSHPFATGGTLDRARRDLELFLLQHRLEPGTVRAGATALDRLAAHATNAAAPANAATPASAATPATPATATTPPTAPSATPEIPTPSPEHPTPTTASAAAGRRA